MEPTEAPTTCSKCERERRWAEEYRHRAETYKYLAEESDLWAKECKHEKEGT